MISQDTICAIATPAGNGAISVIRMSGKNSFSIADKIFFSIKSDKKISTARANSILFGTIQFEDKIIDEVLVSVFKTPYSYTGEDSVEISCHGSVFIQQKILEILIKSGARLANPGEYTMRAFFNGKIDLSQAEAVADLIASSSESSHKIAINQVRGGFSKEINFLRSELLDFISLIELELDFSEEDVQFADREKLKVLIDKIQQKVQSLMNSFKLGNVIKKGIPIAIIGEPNVGKSTLLNAFLNEEKAIVSEIAGTTRDAIEDVIVLNGIQFRFIDTAGIRNSVDTIENIGISKTYEKIAESSIILYVIDINKITKSNLEQKLQELENVITDNDKKIIVVANKFDLSKEKEKLNLNSKYETIYISAKHKINLEQITEKLIQTVNFNLNSSDVIVSNVRHFEALTNVNQAIAEIKNGLESNISGDFLAQDIRQALHYLGLITGQVSEDEILGNIFSRFCIGK
jgi:tRNA modification GTPase